MRKIVFASLVAVNILSTIGVFSLPCFFVQARRQHQVLEYIIKFFRWTCANHFRFAAVEILQDFYLVQLIVWDSVTRFES